MDNKDNTQLGLDILKSLTDIKDALSTAVALFNSMEAPTPLQGVPKVGVSLDVSKESMSIISNIVAAELQDAKFSEDAEKIMAAAVFTIAKIQANEVTQEKAKSIFDGAKIQVGSSLIEPSARKRTSIKIGNLRKPASKKEPALKNQQQEQKKRTPIRIEDYVEAVPEKEPLPTKYIDLSKVVTAAYVAIGTASPAIGTGMLGKKYAAKHLPKQLKKGIAGITAATTGAVISPGAALGAGLQHFKPKITIGLEKRAGKFINRDSKTEKKETAKKTNKPKS